MFQPESLLVVKLEAQHWNIVIAALGEIPLKHSLPVHASIMEQLQAQDPPANGHDIHTPLTMGDMPNAAQ